MCSDISELMQSTVEGTTCIAPQVTYKEQAVALSML